MSDQPRQEHEGTDDAAPAIAWKKFVDLLNDPLFAVERSADEFVELLDPFLTNPARHRRHVRMIVQASQVTRFGQLLGAFPRPADRLGKWILRTTGKKQQRELHDRLKALEAGLTEEVQPADVAVDILPPSSLDTPEDWIGEGRRLKLLRVKVAVNPQESLTPASLSLRLRIDDEDVQFADHYPRSEFEQVGTQEVTFSEEGRFVTSASTAASFGVSGGAHGINAGGRASKSKSTEVSSGKSESRKITFEPTVRKIQSSAVGNTAFWQLLASGKSSPIGGLDFYVTLIVSGEARTMSASVEIDVAFDDWGPLRFDHSAQIKVGGASPAL